jgi:hypothetical protein
MVIDCLLSDPGIGVRDAPQHVVVVLEGIGVDRSKPDTVILGECAKLRIVVDLVPRDVKRDRRGEPGELVHLRGIGDLLLRSARHTEVGEHFETCSRVAEGPGRKLDGLCLKTCGDIAEGHHWCQILSKNRCSFESFHTDGTVTRLAPQYLRARANDWQ